MKRTYTVACKTCYSWYKTGLSSRDADREATSHMNLYQHEVMKNEEYKCAHPERKGHCGGQAA